MRVIGTCLVYTVVGPLVGGLLFSAFFLSNVIGGLLLLVFAARPDGILAFLAVIYRIGFGPAFATGLVMSVAGRFLSAPVSVLLAAYFGFTTSAIGDFDFRGSSMMMPVLGCVSAVICWLACSRWLPKPVPTGEDVDRDVGQTVTTLGDVMARTPNVLPRDAVLER